jgi:hypothetical protein
MADQEDLAARRNAVRAWFEDGVCELLGGVVITLLTTSLFLIGRHGRSGIAGLMVAIPWLWLQIRFHDAVAWVKERLIFPRVGRQPAPPWFGSTARSDFITLDLSGPTPGPPVQRPLSNPRAILAVGVAVAGGLLPFALWHAQAAYLIASAAAVATLWLGAKPVGWPWLLSTVFAAWGVALWQLGPTPSLNASVPLWFIGWGVCPIAAGAISLTVFVGSHPMRRDLVGGV